MLIITLQIALAAVTTAVSRLGENLDHYVTDILFPNEQKHLTVLIEAVRSKSCFYFVKCDLSNVYFLSLR